MLFRRIKTYIPNAHWQFTIEPLKLTDEGRDQPEADLHQAMKRSSKLMNPFYCIREGKKLIV